MIRFLEPRADDLLWQELRDASLLDPQSIGRIDDKLGRPESCSLNAVLLAGADVIPERRWLSWLIRRHGCHRYGRVAWRPEAAIWVDGATAEDGNVPYRQTADGGAILVAVMRPDRLDATRRRLAGRVVLPAAATLAESAELRVHLQLSPICAVV